MEQRRRVQEPWVSICGFETALGTLPRGRFGSWLPAKIITLNAPYADFLLFFIISTARRSVEKTCRIDAVKFRFEFWISARIWHIAKIENFLAENNTIV